MSRLTIRVLDHYCDVWNWNESLKNAYNEDETRRWSKKRDLKLAVLQRAVAKLTPNEISFLKRYNSKIEQELAEVGAPFAGKNRQSSR